LFTFLLIGFVEVGGVIYHYLTMLDLAKEAARFASERDFRVLTAPGSGLPISACKDDPVHYYYDTACMIVADNYDLSNNYDPNANSVLNLNPATDDVAISVFTVNNNTVDERWPNDADGVWSLYSENWTKNCDGSLRSTTPFMTNAELANIYTIPTPTVGSGTSTPTPIAGPTPTPSPSLGKGVVLVEIYYCHEQILNLPVLSSLIPNPVPLHAYAVMPAPAAAPTPTPLP
jgi:hypothetical protein